MALASAARTLRGLAMAMQAGFPEGILEASSTPHAQLSDTPQATQSRVQMQCAGESVDANEASSEAENNLLSDSSWGHDAHGAIASVSARVLLGPCQATHEEPIFAAAPSSSPQAASVAQVVRGVDMGTEGKLFDGPRDATHVVRNSGLMQVQMLPLLSQLPWRCTKFAQVCARQGELMIAPS